MGRCAETARVGENPWSLLKLVMASDVGFADRAFETMFKPGGAWDASNELDKNDRCSRQYSLWNVGIAWPAMPAIIEPLAKTERHR